MNLTLQGLVTVTLSGMSLHKIQQCVADGCSDS